MGMVIKFIPVPVIVGFTAGIGIIIWVGQWKDFLGLSAPDGDYFHQQLWQLLTSLATLDLTTTTVALISLVLVIGTSKVRGFTRVPGPLVALVVLSVVQALFNFETVATIGSAFGEIPRGLPAFSVPELSVARMLDLVGPAFAIAMLGAIESLLSAVVADGMSGTRHNSNQELIGQGLANILTPLFGGIAATGAIARTATNIRNGGTSPLAGIVHVITLILVLVLLAPLAVHIPLATLAAILFVVAWNMSQPKLVFRLLRQAPRADVLILLVTLALTVFVNLVVAVNIGVVLAMLHFLKRMSDSVKVEALAKSQLQRMVSAETLDATPDGVIVLSVEGPFFYAGVDTLERAVEALSSPKALVLSLRYVPLIDGTGLQTLEKMVLSLHAKGVYVVFCDLNPRFKAKLARVGLQRSLGYQALFDDVETALNTVNKKLKEQSTR